MPLCSNGIGFRQKGELKHSTVDLLGNQWVLGNTVEAVNMYIPNFELSAIIPYCATKPDGTCRQSSGRTEGRTDGPTECVMWPPQK